MEKTIWAIKGVVEGSVELKELLYGGWEPFAITEISKPYIIWLRKIVRVEVK